jgi:FAD/FMN-containing dehydrogenase
VPFAFEGDTIDGACTALRLSLPLDGLVRWLRGNNDARTTVWIDQPKEEPGMTTSTTNRTSIDAAATSLRSRMHGDVLTPDAAGYDAARRVWNGMVDKRPALIARCAGTADVVACVEFAQTQGIPVSVRGGGHNYAGKAVCEGGLVIDLSPMRAISVDPDRHIARAQGGVRLGEFDRATQAFGLATTLGVNTDTGIAGLTLGGGYGWLAGKHGLACDNLISAEVVTADGRVLVASAEEHPDFFWGLRGAGANFGVVTEFVYRLHAVGPVVGGMVLHPLTEAVLRGFDAFARSAPDEVTSLGVVMTGPDGKPAFATVVCFCGELEDGEAALAPLRGIATPLADLIAPRPYVEIQALLDDAWPVGRRYYNKAHNVRALDDGTIHTVLDFARALPTPVSNIAFQQLHGAAARVPVDATAFPHRYDHYDLLVHPATDDPADDVGMIRWAQECWQALRPFAERAVYVNALEDARDEGVHRVREAYGSNYGRLAALKRTYDPTNLFRLNANIEPIGPLA